MTTRPPTEYHGEFSDDWAEEMQEDDDIEVLEIEDGEFGLDQGTKKVTFRIDPGSLDRLSEVTGPNCSHHPDADLEYRKIEQGPAGAPTTWTEGHCSVCGHLVTRRRE